MSFRDESGQVIVTTALVLLLAIGMAGLVVDVGSWYTAQRHLQTVADAAALAGAQRLPDEVSAQTVALDYAQLNWGGVEAPVVGFPDAATIRVDADHSAPGYFAKVVDAAFGHVTVRAHAEAKLLAPQALKDVAPVAVPSATACSLADPSCFGEEIDLTFPDSALSSSQAGLVDLCAPGGGSCSSASDLRTLIVGGLLTYAPVGVYYPTATGQKTSLKLALDQRLGDVLLFPVFDPAKTNPRDGYWVIGWAAFRLDAIVSWQPHDWRLRGAFVTYVATGIGKTGGTGPNFGVSVISLTR